MASEAAKKAAIGSQQFAKVNEDAAKRAIPNIVNDIPKIIVNNPGTIYEKIALAQSESDKKMTLTNKLAPRVGGELTAKMTAEAAIKAEIGSQQFAKANEKADKRVVREISKGVTKIIVDNPGKDISEKLAASIVTVSKVREEQSFIGPIQKIKVDIPSGFVMPGSEEYKKKIKEKEELEKASISKIDTLRKKADSFDFFGASKAIKEAEKMKTAGTLTGGDVEELRQLRRNRISTGAGIASFALPTLITPALQGISDNKKYQAGLETASNAGSLALTGLSVGAAYGAKGGAIGAAAGGALGLLSSLPSLMKALNDPLPDLASNLERLKDSFNSSSANAQQYISLTEKISEIQAGNIKNISNADLQRLSSERERAFSSLGPNIQKLVSEAIKKGDMTEANRVIGSQMSAEQSRIGFGNYLNSIKDRKLLPEYGLTPASGFGAMGVVSKKYSIQ
jgi:hypothetical protein